MKKLNQFELDNVAGGTSPEWSAYLIALHMVGKVAGEQLRQDFDEFLEKAPSVGPSFV